MAEEPAGPAKKHGPVRRVWRWVYRGTIVLLALTIAIAWFQREQIADDLIGDVFADSGVQASYVIENISPTRQVLSNIVIGDPARPDLTVERLELSTTPRFGLPDLNELTLVKPRLYGTLKDGQLSFGALDPFIFTGGDEPFEFPDMRLTIEDGRGLLDSDYGRIGLKLAGAGHLRDGFNGEAGGDRA